MATILFDKIVFGPVHSRRLGVSLGINLLPVDGKLCDFDCIYCECGYNSDRKSLTRLPSREEVRSALEEKLKTMVEHPDVITFAGNGEPTIHPEFAQIVQDTVELRDIYAPEAKISVLSNASMLHKEEVFQALNKIDNNILKLDAPFDEKMRLIDRPNSPAFSVGVLVPQLRRFNGNLTIQTMFLSGFFEGKEVDNTSDEEISAWINLLKEIQPKQVMIYTIDRETPAKGLKKIPLEKLQSIADRVRKEGFIVSVAG